MKTLYFFTKDQISINLIQDFFDNNDAKENSKLLWIDKEYLKKLLNENDQHQTERILYRKIASNTNERTMISTLSPKIVIVYIQYIQTARKHQYLFIRNYLLYLFLIHLHLTL